MSRGPGPVAQTLAQGVYLNTGWLPPKIKQGPALRARSYTYDVPAPGKYTYVCVLHLPSGMAGEIDANLSRGRTFRGRTSPFWGRLRTGYEEESSWIGTNASTSSSRTSLCSRPLEEGAPADLPARHLPRGAGGHGAHPGGQARSRVHHRAER